VVQEVEVELFSPKTPLGLTTELDCAGETALVLMTGLGEVADAALELAPTPEEGGAADGAADSALFVVEEAGGALLDAAALLEDARAGAGALLDNTGAGAWLEGGGA
jgi:hypothetical protein